MRIASLGFTVLPVVVYRIGALRRYIRVACAVELGIEIGAHDCLVRLVVSWFRRVWSRGSRGTSGGRPGISRRASRSEWTDGFRYEHG